MENKIKDPVCGMTLEKSSVNGSTEYEGQEYYFCSTGCLDKFKQAPQKYTQENKEGES